MNKKVIWTIIALIGLCFIYIFYEDEIKNIVKFLFVKNVFLWLHTIAVIIIFIIHFFYKIETSSELKILHSE